MEPFDLRKWPGFTPAGGSPAVPAIVDQVSIDSRRLDSPRSLFVALKGEKDDGHSYLDEVGASGAAYAIVSENCSFSPIQGLTLLKVPSPLKALQEIAAAYRNLLPAKVVAIAGSFGKTMVKDLLYSFLKSRKEVTASPESFNSQIGVALSLLSIRQTDEIAIIEAAVSCKEEMNALAEMIRPDFTVFTPAGKKHHGGLEDLPATVKEIYKLASATNPSGWLLLPKEVNLESIDPDLQSALYFWNRPDSRLPHASFRDPGIFSSYLLTFPDGTSFEGSIVSGHAYFLNLINMAVKSAWLLGASASDIRDVLERYKPEPTRTEIWKSGAGTIFINDTYCADPQSVERAVRLFGFSGTDHRRLFVFGGLRGQSPYSQIDYKRIGQILAKARLRYLLLVGKKPYHALTDEILSGSPETEIFAFDHYPEAFSYLRDHLRSDDCIVFKGEHKLCLETLIEQFNESGCNNRCIINLASVEYNLAALRYRLPPQTRMMVIVKALAYGTDDIRMAKFLATCGIDILGVSYVDEGITLKQAGVRQSIFSINAAPYEVSKVVKWDLEVGVNDSSMVEALNAEASAKSKKIKVHLHIDTGMGRFGCRPEDALTLALQIVRSSSLELEGVMTHFSCADNPEQDPFTLEQISLFDRVIARLLENGIDPKMKHAANSAGAIRFFLPQYNMVRIGLAAYGLYASDAVKKSVDLKLALSLTSRIVAVNDCRQGETVGYGRRYTIDRESRKIGILPVGYYDGMHRNYSETTNVLVRGHRAPMVGNICMDYMMVDLTDIPQAAVGDRVLVFGEDEYGFYLSPEELAAGGNSIVHELITCLGPRISRIFIYEESKQKR